MTALTSGREAKRWDVIVFGAGPAGSALARQLAGRYRVLILEPHATSLGQQDTVEWRIGESLPGTAAVLLRRLELFDRFLADGPVERGASVSVWDDATPVWFDSLRDPNGPGWHLDRARFDVMLRNAAREAGAAFAQLFGRFRALREAGAWCVHDGRTGQQYTADVLVDATGRSAALCRSLGLLRHAEDRLVCMHVLLPSSLDGDRCTRTCADIDGWWYSVRVPSGRRVLAFHLDADTPALRDLRDAKALLARARRLPMLREVLPERIESVATRIRPAGSAALDLHASTCWSSLYAVGDAILAFDPIASQGLFHSLASASSAAAAIAKHLEGNAKAGFGYFTEMQEVQSRYFARLLETYAGPERYRECRFWTRRRGPLGLSRQCSWHAGREGRVGPDRSGPHSSGTSV